MNLKEVNVCSMLNLILGNDEMLQRIKGYNSTSAHSTYVQNNKHYPGGEDGGKSTKGTSALQVLSKSKTVLKEGLAK